MFGEVKRQKPSREIGESKRKIMLMPYIEITILGGSKGAERCRALILNRWSCRGTIERCL